MNCAKCHMFEVFFWREEQKRKKKRFCAKKQKYNFEFYCSELDDAIASYFLVWVNEKLLKKVGI